MLYSWDIGNINYQKSMVSIKELIKLSDKDVVFMMKLVSQVIDNVDKYDGAIAACLKDWSISRLNYLDRNILRMALAELVSETETPKQVVINEAIELAKLYSDEKSFKYINGVLGNKKLLAGINKNDFRN